MEEIRQIFRHQLYIIFAILNLEHSGVSDCRIVKFFKGIPGSTVHVLPLTTLFGASNASFLN